MPSPPPDAVIFSGGKAIRGPQTSGFIVGRDAIIRAARLNGCPNEASVCRPMKCSKESIVGLVTALDMFCAQTDEDEVQHQRDLLLCLHGRANACVCHSHNGVRRSLLCFPFTITQWRSQENDSKRLSHPKAVATLAICGDMQWNCFISPPPWPQFPHSSLAFPSPSLRAYLQIPQLQAWEDMVTDLTKALTGTPGIAGLRRVCPGPPDIQPNHIPRLYVDLWAAGADGGPRSSTVNHTGAAIYGDSLDHGNPLAVAPGTPPCTLAHRLVSRPPCTAL